MDPISLNSVKSLSYPPQEASTLEVEIKVIKSEGEQLKEVVTTLLEGLGGNYLAHGKGSKIDIVA